MLCSEWFSIQFFKFLFFFYYREVVLEEPLGEYVLFLQLALWIFIFFVFSFVFFFPSWDIINRFYLVIIYSQIIKKKQKVWHALILPFVKFSKKTFYSNILQSKYYQMFWNQFLNEKILYKINVIWNTNPI